MDNFLKQIILGFIAMWGMFSLLCGNDRGEVGDGGDPGDGGKGGKGDGGSGDGGSKEKGDGGSGNDGGKGDGGSGSGDPDGGGDTSKFSPEALKVIKDLRAENAKHRTTNNHVTARLDKFESGFKEMFGDAADKMTPEQKLEQSTSMAESAQYDNTVLGMAIENGISGGDQLDYFKFLVSSSVDSLKEGEEMTDESLVEIVKKAKGTAGQSKKDDDKDGANSSVGSGDSGTGGNIPDPTDNKNLTLEEFNNMGVMGKTALYRKNKPLYESLMKQSRDKKLIKY